MVGAGRVAAAVSGWLRAGLPVTDLDNPANKL